MAKTDQAWLSILSELLVNLAAGWFGAAVIIPQTNMSVVILNVGFGIFSLVISHQLRKLYP